MEQEVSCNSCPTEGTKEINKQKGATFVHVEAALCGRCDAGGGQHRPLQTAASFHGSGSVRKFKQNPAAHTLAH